MLNARAPAFSRHNVPELCICPCRSSSPGLTGRSSIPETAVLEPRSHGVLDAPHEAGHDSGVGDVHPRSRGMIYPRFSFRRPSTVGGSRECRVHAAPAVSCARLHKESAHTSIQVQRRQSGIPCAMVLRLMPCSPRRRIRLVTVAAGLMADRSGWIKFATDSLAPATGVGTTRFCRTRIASFVLRAVYRSRVLLALRSPCAPTLPRPPHPIPRS
jgi:hypothetical protein